MKTRWTAPGLACLIAVGAGWAAYRAAPERSADGAGDATPPARPPASIAADAAPAGRPRAGAAATAAAPFSLSAPVAHPMPGNAIPTFLAVGDLNADGRDDIVAGRVRLAILSQTADGRLEAAPSFDSQSNANSIILANLNGDTLPDIVIGQAAGIVALVADGSGGYRAYPDIQMVWRFGAFGALAAADIDGDGYQDILASLYSNAGSYFEPWTGQVFYGNGDGTFRVGGNFAYPHRLVAGDFDGNGLPDLAAVGASAGSGVSVYASDSRTMQPNGSAALPDNRYTPVAIAAGDFDSDGRNDYAVVATDSARAMKLWVYNTDAAGQPRPPGAALNGRDAPTAARAVDLDRDGRTDLVVLHRSGVSYYLQGPNGLQAAQYVPLLPDAMIGPDAFGTGDLNGDGCTDVAVAVDQTGVGVRVLYGQNCAPKPARRAQATQDVDLDGKSDLLWRHPSGSNWGYWRMDGAQRLGGSPAYALDPSWQPLAVGRYAADDALNLLWTDRRSIWMSRARAGSQDVPLAVVRPYPAGYRLVASGDIDGDGVDDLVWRDDANTTVAAWTMSAGGVRAGKAYHLPPSWRIAGSGDFDGDGRLDLIWTDGQKMRLWAGAANLSFADRPMGGYPLGWELIGSGDVDGDGRADLFWRRADLNAFVVWYMDGARRTGGDSYTVDASWRVMDSGDFDGDGKTDLVWTNGTLMQLWRSNGRSFAGLPMADYPQHWTTIKN